MGVSYFPWKNGKKNLLQILGLETHRFSGRFFAPYLLKFSPIKYSNISTLGARWLGRLYPKRLNPQNSNSGFWILQAGVSVLSFAIVGPLFLLFMLYTFELGEVFFIKNALEASVREGARFGIVQDPQPGVDRVTAIQNKVKEIAEDASAGLIKTDTADFSVSIKSYGSLALIEQPEPFVDANSNGVKDAAESFTDVNGNGVYDTDQGAAGPGGDGSAVIYEVTYKFHSVAPLFNFYMADMDISARTVVVNDLFKVD